MDWLTFISSIVESLAWPIIFIMALLIFRKPILKILSSVKLLKYQNLEIKLEKEIDELKQKTKKIEKTKFKDHTLDVDNLESLDIDDKIKEVAEISPSASIILAWKEIEKELRAAVERAGISLNEDDIKLPFNCIKLLDYNGLIDDTKYHFLNELRSIRNTIVHTAQDSLKLDRESAIDYAHMARIARRSLKEIGN